MGLDHCIVIISPISKELEGCKSVKFAIFRDSDDFKRDYGLRDSDSQWARSMGNNIKLRVKLQGDVERQNEYCYSNNPDLIKAVKTGDHSHIKTWP